MQRLQRLLAWLLICLPLHAGALALLVSNLTATPDPAGAIEPQFVWQTYCMMMGFYRNFSQLEKTAIFRHKRRSMAIGWVGMLRLVPWGDVIKAAPELASTARKLWGAVAKKNPHHDAVNGDDGDEGALHAPTSMLARMEHAETSLAELQAQMLAASEVIATLAQQNAKLVEQTEALRKRLLLQAIVTGVISVGAIVFAITAWLSRSIA